ncbi:MAG: 4Fe-4S binding protein [Alphaproteobacteria bacterium]|nr:4Fe-4S binding protein [Alphaproteobacteria bacterium]
MTNIMSEVPENRCCGCGSCAVKCPVGAISMQENALICFFWEMMV